MVTGRARFSARARAVLCAVALAAATSTFEGCTSRDPISARPDSGLDDTGVAEVGDGGDASRKVVPPGAEAALAAYHGVFCRSYQACFPHQFESAYTDEATCVARRVKGSLAALFGPGSTLSAANIEACTATYPSTIGCDDVLELFGGNPVIPPACEKDGGKLVADSPCTGSDQCQGGICRLDLTSRCGTCGARVGFGGACKVDSQCVESALCTSGKCTPPAALGGACDATQRCRVSQACVSGKCVDRVKGLGTACDSTAQNCENTLFCNLKTSTCEAFVTAKLGEPCYRLDSGSLAVCEAGAKCNALTPNKCVPAAKEGEPCFRLAPFGSQCEAPLQCIGSQCVLIDSEACR